MWLANEILNWDKMISSYSVMDYETRSYDIWHHSEKLLVPNVDPLFLTDVICSLKRSIHCRLNAIENIQNLSNITLPKYPRKSLEQLGYLGLIRPTLLKKLINIRNKIEHEDTPPPNYSRCLELLDSVWYFLKITDQLVNYPTTEIEFNLNCKEDQWINIQTGPEYEWNIIIRGKLSNTFISKDKTSKHFKINRKGIIQKKDFIYFDQSCLDPSEDLIKKEILMKFLIP